MVETADSVLQEETVREGLLSNEGYAAVEAVRDAVAQANRNELTQKIIKNKIKDEQAKKK